MTTPDAFDGEQLLSGSLDPDDAPQQLKELAGLIRVARAPMPGTSPDADRAFIAAIADEVRRSAQLGQAIAPSHLRLVRRLPSGRVATVTAALMFTGGLAAAAATGSLPAPIQRALSHGIAHVGISIPDPHRVSPKVPTRVTVTTVATGATKTRSVASAFGLCETYLHSPRATVPGTSGAAGRAPVASRLAAIASSHGEGVRAYCENLVNAKGQVSSGTSNSHRSTTTSHSPTTSNGSHTGTTTLPAGTTRKGAHQTGVHAPASSTGNHRSTRPANTAGGSTTHSVAPPVAPASSKRASTESTTTTSPLPANSASGASPTGAQASNKGGGGVSAAQTK